MDAGVSDDQSSRWDCGHYTGSAGRSYFDDEMGDALTEALDASAIQNA